MLNKKIIAIIAIGIFVYKLKKLKVGPCSPELEILFNK